jgi:hypothetical protein
LAEGLIVSFSLFAAISWRSTEFVVCVLSVRVCELRWYISCPPISTPAIPA